MFREPRRYLHGGDLKSRSNGETGQRLNELGELGRVEQEKGKSWRRTLGFVHITLGLSPFSELHPSHHSQHLSYLLLLSS